MLHLNTPIPLRRNENFFLDSFVHLKWYVFEQQAHTTKSVPPSQSYLHCGQGLTRVSVVAAIISVQTTT